MKEIYRVKTLVYVPNTYCNLGCSYCYLGSHTDKTVDTYENITSNLKIIVDEFLEQGIVIEQFMLHGAEITTVPKKYLEILFKYIAEYHNEYQTEIKTFGHSFAPIHIKTNLFNYDTLIDLFEQYKVSVSGSVDLPLSLHAKYRVTKKGKSTVDKIMKNVKSLATYKYGRQISCVVTKEHLVRFDEFVKDLKYLHEDVGFDMINNFYVMFGYDSFSAQDKFGENFEDGALMLNHVEMVEFYNKIKEEFKDTPYEKAIKYNWFKEFLPNFCTTELNCGNEHILIQKDGDAYPCHRAQPDPAFKFGNVLKEGLSKIVEKAPKIIEGIENQLEMDSACTKCEYFKYCYLGCPLTRKDTKLGKSYTCMLQKELYKDNPLRWPVPDPIENRKAIDTFIRLNNVKVYDNDKNIDIPRIISFNPEIYHEDNSLGSIIKKDPKLQKMYDKDAFKIKINDVLLDLESAVFSNYKQVFNVSSKDIVHLYVKKDFFKIHCKEEDLPSNNLLIMGLRDTMVSYGDEGRTKQEHIFDENIYYNTLFKRASEVEGYFVYNISSIFNKNKKEFLPDVINNIFFTTKEARLYHYEKHAKNAFYHIQAINLPFHNFMFKYNDID